MKKILYLLIVIIFLVAAYFVTAQAFPKNAGRFVFFVILLALDIYLWISLRKKIVKLKSLTQWFFRVLYWWPFAALIASGIYSLFVPSRDWDTGITTYFYGLILIFYSSKILTIVFFLIADLFKVLHFTFKFNKAKIQKKPFKQESVMMNRAKFLKTIGLAGGGLLFSGMVIGVVKWAYDFRVKRSFVKLPNLPASMDGFRIVQISDTHLGSWASEEPLNQAVDMINELDPDIVVFTGDLVNSTTSEAFRFKNALQRIKARKGIFSVLGNHDYGDYVSWPDQAAKDENMQQLYDLYKDLGWKLLNNENQVINYKDGSIAILGVENWSQNKRFPRRGDIEKAKSGTEDADVKVLLSHDPSHWERIISRDQTDIDLTLSGHTHGFQFGVEFKNFRWSLAQYVYKYWAGLYTMEHNSKNQYLYVNRGLGMIGYPGRVGILPEITLITLNS